MCLSVILTCNDRGVKLVGVNVENAAPPSMIHPTAFPDALPVLGKETVDPLSDLAHSCSIFGDTPISPFFRFETILEKETLEGEWGRGGSETLPVLDDWIIREFRKTNDKSRHFQKK